MNCIDRSKNKKHWEWLAELALENQWKTGAELGVKEGETLFYLLEHCPALYMIGVDLWELQPEKGREFVYNKYDHKSNERIVREKAKSFFGQVLLIKDYTVKAAERVKDASLDFVFIDADHETESVIADIAAWRAKVKKGGLLCGHDVSKKTVRDALGRVLQYYLIEPGNCWSYYA